MNRENVQTLISAITSGDWNQGKGALHKEQPEISKGDYDNTDQGLPYHCCLGVAECIMPKELVKPAKDNPGGSGAINNSPNYSAIRDWLGLTNAQIERIMNINDNKKKTFKSVAQYLEDLLEEDRKHA